MGDRLPWDHINVKKGRTYLEKEHDRSVVQLAAMADATMMSRYRLLALDIDGTLVNSRDELTPATSAAIARACNAGIRVVLATGRRYSKTLHLVEPLKLDVPLITASGALIKDPLDHRTLFCAQFKSGVLEATLQTVATSGYDVLLYGDTYSQGVRLSIADRFRSQNQPLLAEYFERNRGSGREFPN